MCSTPPRWAIRGPKRSMNSCSMYSLSIIVSWLSAASSVSLWMKSFCTLTRASAGDAAAAGQVGIRLFPLVDFVLPLLVAQADPVGDFFAAA